MTAKNLLLTLAVFFVTAALNGCATMEAGSDIRTAWEKGVIFTPEKEGFVSLAEIPSMTKQYPVVIFMHGCTGIEESGELPWGKYLRDLGNVVVIPNSVARRDRGPSCDPRSASYYGSHTTHRLRQQEIDYALEKIQASPWSDKKNLFLMGHSEGGIAAARTKHGEFNGIIISGWTCTSKYEGYAGIYSPKNVPVLSLLWNWDRWFPTGGHSDGTCAGSLAGRPNSRHVTLDGYNHNTFPSPVAREAVEKFLKENMVK